MRNIGTGDIVTVLVNDEESDLWMRTRNQYELRTFRVESTPSDTGDMWYLKDVDNDTELAINPSSANLDGFVKEKKTLPV